MRAVLRSQTGLAGVLAADARDLGHIPDPCGCQPPPPETQLPSSRWFEDGVREHTPHRGLSELPKVAEDSELENRK